MAEHFYQRLDLFLHTLDIPDGGPRRTLGFLRRTGVETVVAGGGPRGRTVIAPARALGRSTAHAAPGVRSKTNAPVAFTWDGSTYTIEFSE